MTTFCKNQMTIHYISSGYVGRLTVVVIIFTTVFQAVSMVSIVVVLRGVSRQPPHSPRGPGVVSDLAFRDKILNATLSLWVLQHIIWRQKDT
jgi:hypothetical protein